LRFIFIHIGFQNYVLKSKICGIIDINTASIRKIIATAKRLGAVYDVSKNRTAKSAVVCTDGNIFLSPISTQVLISRAAFKIIEEE
jgi:regulator of extracellular matrix RemA (YlzA/DUF370 family)